MIHPEVVTLRIGLIDKSDAIPADKCCRQHNNSTPNKPDAGKDPLPVGYAGFYANDPNPPKKLPSWGIFVPVFRPLINLPIIHRDGRLAGKDSEKIYRVAYYISTAARPSHHADHVKTLLAAQKKFLLSSDDVGQPPSHIEPDTDEHGDWINKESIASHDDLLENYEKKNDDAHWDGTIFEDPSGPSAVQQTKNEDDPNPLAAKATENQNDTPSEIPSSE